MKDRIHSTYMYLAGSIGLTASSALAVNRTPSLKNFMMKGSSVLIGATFAAVTGAGMLIQSVSYYWNPGPKHLAWLFLSGVISAMVAPQNIMRPSSHQSRGVHRWLCGRPLQCGHVSTQ